MYRPPSYWSSVGADNIAGSHGLWGLVLGIVSWPTSGTKSETRLLSPKIPYPIYHNFTLLLTALLRSRPHLAFSLSPLSDRVPLPVQTKRCQPLRKIVSLDLDRPAPVLWWPIESAGQALQCVFLPIWTRLPSLSVPWEVLPGLHILEWMVFGNPGSLRSSVLPSHFTRYVATVQVQLP